MKKPALGLELHTPTLLGLAKRASPDDRRKIETLHREWERRFAATPSDVQREGLAAGIHQVIDDAQARRQVSPGEPPISCQKGCAACCHQLVSITPDEARLLLFAAEEAGHMVDHERLERQASAFGLQGWRTLSHADKRCVMLGDDDACAVYEHRPSACRKYQVVSSPALCDIETHPGAQVAVAVSTEAEVIFSAAIAVFGTGAFARQLRKAFEEVDES